MTIWSEAKKFRLQIAALESRDHSEDSEEIADFAPVVAPLPHAVANMLRNGDKAHSVRTWYNGAAGNQDYEAAHWFTHDAPVAGQQLDESTGFSDLNVDGDGNAATNKTLKSSSHAQYDASMCDWDRANGVARLQGTKSLDAVVPGNTATPNAGLLALAFRAALRSSRIVVPAGFRLGAGVWDNTAGQRNYLRASASFQIAAAVRGSAASTVERRYKVFLYTDRGYTFISDAATVANAPADGHYTDANVYLSWALIPGVLAAHVIMYEPTSGIYRVLTESAINTYLDNGTYEDISPAPTAYPTATDDRAKAYVATADDALASLAVDGVDAAWDSVFLNIPIPPNYNSGLTGDKQWLRISANMALDRRVTDAVVAIGSANCDSATAEFSALDTGLAATLTDGAGNTHSTTITYLDADSVTLAAPWPHASATDVTLYITGGGHQGILLDLSHISYAPGSIYAPHPDDMNRTLPPAAAPDGSSQGGVGTGGGGTLGGGGISCVEINEPVLILEAGGIRSLPYKHVQRGQAVYTGELRPSFVTKKWGGIQPLIRVRTRAGVELLCSPSHRVITTRRDTEGRAVFRLRVGDPVMVTVEGRIFQTAISSLEATGETAEVGTLSLAPGNIYAAGRMVARTFRGRVWRWILRHLGQSEPVAGILSHNRKAESGLEF